MYSSWSSAKPARVQVEVEQVRPGLEDRLERPVVGRVLADDALAQRAGAQEHPEPLQPAVGQEDAVGVDAEALGEELAERRVAEARPVGEDPRAVGGQHRRGAVGELVGGHELGREALAGEGDRFHVGESRSSDSRAALRSAVAAAS